MVLRQSIKNLFVYTKMRNVAGLSQASAQKSIDLFMKCRYMDEETGNRGNIHATGTPVSNSLVELYTTQRYLQYDKLEEMGLIHFDAWASVFCEPQASIELAPEGTGYRARTRLAKFHNLPELMAMFRDIADIQTREMLNLPVPEAEFRNIILEPSELQKEMVQALAARATAVQRKLVDPRRDNMLKITTDGRKIGLDQRLMNPLLPDHEDSKATVCAQNIFDVWESTKDKQLTQLAFCDYSTPNKDGRFNVYDDIRDKLLALGIPEHEIAFIHDADTEAKKKELFAKVRRGKVRILFGSTAKMGTGTNVQDRLIALHDIDCPWRPVQLTQRLGRLLRQGNKNPHVIIFRYATTGTFDAYLWQTVENKQKIVSQIITGKSPIRSCEDVDETALSYAEIKALCAGNPLIAEKMNLDVDVTKLLMLKSEHQSQCHRLEDAILKQYPQEIASLTERITGTENDIKLYAQHLAAGKSAQTDIQEGKNGSVSTTAPFYGMTINGITYTEKEPAGKALLDDISKAVVNRKDTDIGSYMGFDIILHYIVATRSFTLALRGSMTHQVELSTDTVGNITRINNALENLPKKLEAAKEKLANTQAQQEAAKQELQRPFAEADELAEKEARLAVLNAELNIDGDEFGKSSEAGFETNADVTDIDALYNDDIDNDSYDINNTIHSSSEPSKPAAFNHSGRPSFLDKVPNMSHHKPPSDVIKSDAVAI